MTNKRMRLASLALAFIMIISVFSIMLATGASAASTTIAQAKSIALKQAGLKSADVKFSRARTEKNRNITKYELKFRTSEASYEVEILADNGKIIEYEKEYFKDLRETRSSATKGLSISQAKSVILKHAGLKSSQVEFGEIETDYEDGRKIYQIEFSHDDDYYEYDIEVNTGEIVKIDAAFYEYY